MDIVYTTVMGWVDSAIGSTWGWFNSLSREEWVVVLGVAAACGFLCMRGFSAKANF